MKTILVDAFRTIVKEGNGLDTAMYELLEQYPNPKIILTNANKEQMVALNLVDLPYEMFTLSHNPDKDDPIFYETFLKQYDLTVEDIVYFEHNAEAVASARSLGITAYHFDHTVRDLDAVKDFLDTNL